MKRSKEFQVAELDAPELMAKGRDYVLKSRRLHNLRLRERDAR